MDMDLLHDITFYIMYGAAAIAAFVAVERYLFFRYNLQQARNLEAALQKGVRGFDEIPEALRRRDSLPLELLRQLYHGKPGLTAHHELEDLSQSIYISMRGKLVHGLWILEMVVAAAPLLGLLGTILGIIDTFKALADAGVSDPADVSRGIGTALYATALGIAITLVGLVFNSQLQDRLELINDQLKMLLLRAGTNARPAPEPADGAAYDNSLQTA